MSTENFQKPIIGRPVLKSLKYDSREFLTAAKDKYGKDVDVKNGLSKHRNEKESSRKIAALFCESVFHYGETMEVDGLPDEDLYVYFSYDLQEEVDKKLDKRVKERATGGSSDTEINRLKKSINNPGRSSGLTTSRTTSQGTTNEN